MRGKELISNFTFKVDMFEFYKSGFLYIDTIHCEVDYVELKTIEECICEAIRSKQYDASTSTKLNSVIYRLENCVASVPEYPMPSGYINKNNPFIFSKWSKLGVKNANIKNKKAK